MGAAHIFQSDERAPMAAAYVCTAPCRHLWRASKPTDRFPARPDGCTAHGWELAATAAQAPSAPSHPSAESLR